MIHAEAAGARKRYVASKQPTAVEVYRCFMHAYNPSCSGVQSVKAAAEQNKPGRNAIALDPSTLTVYKDTAVNNYTET